MDLIVLFNSAYLKMHQTICVLMSVLLIADGFTVRGPSGPLVAPLGSSVVLPCYVDELFLKEGLAVEWRRTDSEALVHLYQDGKSRPEAQQQEYHDRAHFFTDQIQHGNFSLRLDNLRAGDEGKYTCKVYSQEDSGETEVQIKDVERLLVSGSNQSIISASVGEDVTLSCSVDSHITPEHIEEVSWKKTDEDEDILVLLYQDNEPLPESAHEQYRDRVEFFTDEIPKGNFSLRLKSVRTEDKGVYMCQVFAGGLSANATVVLQRLGFSFTHIMVLMLCIAASGVALLLCIIIYCRSQNTDSTASKHVRTLGFLHVFLPNIMMFVAFVLWGVTEGFLYETVSCCSLYILRPLMLIFVAPYLKKSGPCLLSENVIFMVVYFSVLASRAWGNTVNYGESEKIPFMAMFGVAFGLMVLFIGFVIIYLFTDEMECCGENCKWIVEKVAIAGAFIFFILPSLQFILLFATFGARGGGGVFVTTIFPLFFFFSFSCAKDIKKEKKRLNLLNIISWMIFMFIMTAVLLHFYITTLKNEKDGAGWTCTAVYAQVLWMTALCFKVIKDLDLLYRKMLYVFGSVGVVLLNSVTLMTELILKTVNGKRAVGDLRVVVFSSESIFAFSLMILIMFKPWISDMKCLQCCQKAARTDDIPDTGSNQNRDSQNAAASDEALASGSNQNTVELHVMNPLLNQDQEAGRE